MRVGSTGTAFTDFSSQAYRRHDRAVIVIAFDSAVSIKYIYLLTALSVSCETITEMRKFLKSADQSYGYNQNSKLGGLSMQKPSFRKTPLATGIALALGATAFSPVAEGVRYLYSGP